MKFVDDAKLKFGVWNRERKERAEEKKAQRRVMEYGFDRTPARIRFAVQLATYGVIGFLLLWITQMTGVLQLDLALDWAVDRPLALDWDLQLDLNILPLIVLAIVSFAIVFWSKAWVSLFASTPWREWFSKWGSLVLGIGGSMAIVMGGFEVNQHTREEDFRGALVQEQSAEQGRAQLQAQLTAIDQRLAGMRNQETVGTYAAIAASVGATAYDENYLSDEALARTDPARRDLVRRARGAAVAADTLEAQRLQLAGQLAVATPAAATAATVEMSDPVSQFIGSIGAWRIVVLVLVGDLILLLGNYFADKAEERRRYATSVQASGWADEGHRIEDLREQEPIAREPMTPQREAVFDAETGEELTPVRATWRKKPKKKGERGQMETAADAPLTERNSTTDGGNRTAVTLGGAMELDSAATSGGESAPGHETHEATGNAEPNDGEQLNASQDNSPVFESDGQTEPSDPILSQQEQEDIDAELAAESAAIEPAPENEQHGESEQAASEAESETDHHKEPREPLTDPSRLIAAE